MNYANKNSRLELVIMRYKIRDWEKHFEQDRSKQWKNIRWVPIPNKQGAGYRKIMSQKNGLEIFSCWIALVQQASLCTPRGDLSKYSIDDLSLLTLIKKEILEKSLKYLSEVLDWIEVTINFDKDVKKVQKNVSEPAVGSSILSSSILSSSVLCCKRNNKNVPAIKYGDYVLLTEEEYNRMIDDWGESFTKLAISQYDQKYPNSKAIKGHSDHNRGIRDWVNRGFICQGKTHKPKQKESKKETVPIEEQMNEDDAVMIHEITRTISEKLSIP